MCPPSCSVNNLLQKLTPLGQLTGNWVGSIRVISRTTRAVVGQRSSPAGYILYCNIFIIKPYNIGHTDLDVFVCKSFCHIDIIIQV